MGTIEIIFEIVNTMIFIIGLFLLVFYILKDIRYYKKLIKSNEKTTNVINNSLKETGLLLDNIKEFHEKFAEFEQHLLKNIVREMIFRRINEVIITKYIAKALIQETLDALFNEINGFLIYEAHLGHIEPNYLLIVERNEEDPASIVIGINDLEPIIQLYGFDHGINEIFDLDEETMGKQP